MRNLIMHTYTMTIHIIWLMSKKYGIFYHTNFQTQLMISSYLPILYNVYYVCMYVYTYKLIILILFSNNDNVIEVGKY